MKRSLAGAQAKVERAKEHLDQLKTLAEEFRRLNTKTLVFDYDFDRGEYFVDVIAPTHPPLRWAVIIGDIAHNLRSALEHVAFQFDSAPPKRREFPVFWEQPKLDNAVKGGIPQRFPKRAWAIIERMQPCKYGRHFYRRALYRLHETNRRDKHQLPHFVYTLLPHPRLWFSEKDADGNIRPGKVIPGLPVYLRVKPGTVRVTLEFPHEGSNVYVNGEFAFQVGLDEPDFKYRGPVIVFL